MKLARQIGAILLWAAAASRGLFAQQLPDNPDRLLLRGVELRYLLPEPLFQGVPAADPIKALYVNAWAFGGSKLQQLVHLADSTEINAFVVDVKDDTGCLLYPSEVKVAQEIGATRCVRTRDLKSRLDTLRAHDIYAIARIVVAKDPLLAERKAQWSVQHRDGGLWRDRINIAWVDAFNDSVWIYAAQLAEEAVRFGFSEVQFDYVRFPDEPKEAMALAIFPARKAGESQRAGVQAGIAILVNRLQPLGVPVTFDIFGLTASTTSGDLGIGQVWEDFVSVADVVLPMVYPSHYYRGSYGIAWPNGEPYRIVRNALLEAIERSRPMPKAAVIRPYLQAFTLGRRKPRYTPHEIREQIRAAEELGIETWVLWNPRSVYQRESLRPYREPTVTVSGGTQ